MRRFLIAGNWKMNLTRGPAVELASAVAAAVPPHQKAVEVVVAPPFPYLLSVAEAIRQSGVALSAQNVYYEEPGAFTGEVAVEMLLDVGCRYVILGHSERRHLMGETDELINRKVAAAVGKGLRAIFCVGETLAQREDGRTEHVLDGQMERGLAGRNADDLKQIVIAYEPVWAIGTGKTATPEQAESAHAHLRKWLSGRYNSAVSEDMRILYGGSVKPDNAAALLKQPNVDGALVGGASLKADQFLAIIEAGRAAADSG